MEQRKSIKTATRLLALMLATGVLALAALIYARQHSLTILIPPTEQSLLPVFIETPTRPPALVGQASTTPQVIAQRPDVPSTASASATLGTQLPIATIIAVVEGTSQVQVSAAVPQAGTGPAQVEVTQVPQNPVPTALAAKGNVTGNPPHSVPGTGAEDPPAINTPPPLLPSNESTGVDAGGHADGSAKVNTPEPTPKLPNAPPTTTIVKVPATVKPKPGQIILPNGVVYGERKPNLPNRIVRIMSPNTKLDTSVYEVYAPKGTWEVADYAAGHNYNSKNPGEDSNIVLAGHNNWHGEVFRYVVDLKPGDLIKVWTLDGAEHHYTVQSSNKVLEAGASYAQRLKNAKVMDPTPSEQLTLITCWPYTTFTHRVIVVAVPSP